MFDDPHDDRERLHGFVDSGFEGFVIYLPITTVKYMIDGSQWITTLFRDGSEFSYEVGDNVYV